MLVEISRIAVRNIKRRRLRSLLTILGIAVGIASIVLFVSIGEGLKNFVLASLGEVGNELVVAPGFDRATGEQKALSMEHVRKIEKIRGVTGAAPRLQSFLFMEYRGRAEPCVVLGVDPEREKKLGVKLSGGRFLKNSDRYSAVLGFRRQNISEFREKGSLNYANRDTEGRNIQIKLRRHIILKSMEEEYKFKVVGILEEGALAGDFLSGGDNAVIVPRETLRKIVDTEEEISQIIVRIENPQDADKIAEEIEKITGGNVISMKKIIKSIGSFFKAVQLLFFAIGSIALIVAGFGIMNTMLMSVLERTREIGVLKSIGARRRHILEIFLVEAGIMGFAGGVIGTAAGVIVAKLGNLLISMALVKTFHLAGEASSQIPALISTPLWLIFFSIAFSVIMSMVFGLYPAWRASSLNPVEALRQL